MRRDGAELKNTFSCKEKERGQVLVEAVLALAIFGMVSLSMVALTAGSFAAL